MPKLDTLGMSTIVKVAATWAEAALADTEVWLACALSLLACILYLTNVFFLLESSSRLVFIISPVTACILIFKNWHMA